MSLQLIVTCLAVTLAMVRFEFSQRARNALLAGGVAAAGAVLENGFAGDWLRASFFAPACFLVAASAVHLGYAWRQRCSTR